MKSFADSKVGLILSAVLSTAIAAGVFLLLSSGGVVFESASLDFGHLVPWLSAGAILLMLSRAAGLAHRSIEDRGASTDNPNSEEEDSPAATANAETEGASEFPAATEESQALDRSVNALLPILAISRGVLVALGVALLVAGLLTAVSSLPSTLADRPEAPDVEELGRYLQIFGELIKWIFVAALLYAAIRVAGVLWPAGEQALLFPWRQVLALTAAYVLLANGGVLPVAFEFPGTVLLVVIAIALLLPHLSVVGRRLLAIPLPARVSNAVRAFLLISDTGWMALVLGIMVSLPGIAGEIPALQEGGALESVAPYLEILDTLALWSAVLLVPFIIIRVIASFRPVVGEVFGFPMGRIILFALALISFSGNGVPATASGLPIPELMPAMGAALLVSYITVVLRRVGQLGLPDRIAIPLTNIPPLIGAFMPALSASLVAWAFLQSLPLISAPLMDFDTTEAFGKNSLPYFAGLFDARHALTAFAFSAVLFLALPDPLWTPARLRVRPMLAAVGFVATGCLGWLSLAPLSGAGHVFPLTGAIIGTGFITLGLCQLAGYLDGHSDPLYSDSARWLTNSKTRGFLIGGALAFYGMLLRPAMYETLWFAAVYEWVVVLSIAIWAIFKIRGNMKTFVETAEATPTAWARWERHEQQFQDLPDPRRNLLARWQHGFVESGQWVSLWSYLMALLSRNNASPEDVNKVFQPLRGAVAGPGRKKFWRIRDDGERKRREAGLAQCLRSAEEVLSNTSASPVMYDSFSPRERVEESASSALTSAAQPFIETGDNPEAVAAAVISEYRRRGADTNHAVNLWFPLVNVVDRPSGWFQFPWVRRRNRARARERRSRLVQGALSHLYGDGTLASLPVGIAAHPAPLAMAYHQTGSAPSGRAAPSGASAEGPSPAGNAPGLSRFAQHQMTRASAQDPAGGLSPVGSSLSVAPGQGFELLQETDNSYLVRTSENIEGYVSKSALHKLPILPGDEVDGT